MTTTAKTRLLQRLDNWIEDHERDMGVATQMNVAHARGERELLAQLTDDQAEQVESTIAKKESYDPATDKYGFGPISISPLDFMAFLDDEDRKALGLRPTYTHIK